MRLIGMPTIASSQPYGLRCFWTYSPAKRLPYPVRIPEQVEIFCEMQVERAVSASLTRPTRRLALRAVPSRTPPHVVGHVFHALGWFGKCALPLPLWCGLLERPATANTPPADDSLILRGSIWQVPDLPWIQLYPSSHRPPPPPPKGHFWTVMHGSGHWALGKAPQPASGPEAGHHHHPTTKNEHDEQDKQDNQDEIRDGSNRCCHMSAGWCPGCRAHWSPRPKIRGPEAATSGF